MKKLFTRIITTLSDYGTIDYLSQQAPASKSRTRLRAYLGTIPNYSQTDQKGVLLSGVTQKGPADIAGLESGDLVIELSNLKIENILENHTSPLIFALLAGLLYAFSAVLCKKGLELGSGTIRSLVFSNFIMSACFLPYPLLSSEPISFYEIGIGATLGLLFFLGQFFCFWALKNGEASLITPIMGSKPIFVALFVVLHGLSTERITWTIWVASSLAAIAIALIGWPEKQKADAKRKYPKCVPRSKKG